MLGLRLGLGFFSDEYDEVLVLWVVGNGISRIFCILYILIVIKWIYDKLFNVVLVFRWQFLLLPLPNFIKHKILWNLLCQINSLNIIISIFRVTRLLYLYHIQRLSFIIFSYHFYSKPRMLLWNFNCDVVCHSACHFLFCKINSLCKYLFVWVVFDLFFKQDFVVWVDDCYGYFTVD